MGEVTESDFIEPLFEQVVGWGLLAWALGILTKVCFLFVAQSYPIGGFHSFIANFMLDVAISGRSLGFGLNLCLFFGVHGRIEEGLLWGTLSTRIQFCFTLILSITTSLFHSLGQLLILFFVHILKAFVLVAVTCRCFWKILHLVGHCQVLERIVHWLFAARRIFGCLQSFLKLGQLKLQDLYFTS